MRLSVRQTRQLAWHMQGPVHLLQLWPQYRGDYRGRFRYGKVHYLMADHYLAGTRQSTVVHRNLSKTTVGGIGTPIYRGVREPWRRHMSAGTNKDKAGAVVGSIRELLAGRVELCGDEFWFADLFPHMEPVTRGTSSTTGCEGFNIMGRMGAGKEPSFYAAAPGATNAGDHPTDGHLDDLTTEKNYKSLKEREKSIDFIRRLTPMMRFGLDSPLTHAGTPWAYYDTSAFIRDHPDWKQLRMGVLDSPWGEETLCPEFLNLEEFRHIEASEENWFVQSQYHCNPVAGKNQLMDREFVDGCTDEQLTTGRLSADFPRYGTILLWDPTHRIDPDVKSGSANGLVVVKAVPAGVLRESGYEPTRNIFTVIRAYRVHGGADAAVQWIENEARKLHPDLAEIWIEREVCQEFARPWLERGNAMGGIRISAIKRRRASLEYHLMGLQTGMRQGYVRLAPAFEGREDLISELVEYPTGDYDDLAAAASLLSNQYARYGTILAPEIVGFRSKSVVTWPHGEYPGGAGGDYGFPSSAT